ncbi:hypothetical protein D9V32_00670 [Mycetocola tolaasinivorans]|uniref:Uncharacterized protein n=1 Tax=Mycetocola tolaasinivorans TaxID=76635 RepID=A0A3L7AE06_9MICO|nr:hypothetical protein [Mycetocola tolaasinivorans]RLP77881.1 hypothetical protein D9V32_00670 [Mycetocola tolaasinivorans]
MTTPAAVPPVLSLPVPVPAEAGPSVRIATARLGTDHLATAWADDHGETRVGVLELRSGEWSILSSTDLLERAPHAAAILTTLSAETPATNAPAPVALPIPEAAGRRGVRRILSADANLLIGVTGTHPHEGQRLLVFAARDQSELASLDLPHGYSGAFRALDGVIVAPAALGETREFLALTGLPPVSPWRIDPADPAWTALPIPGDASTLPAPGQLSIISPTEVRTLGELAAASTSSVATLLAPAG